MSLERSPKTLGLPLNELALLVCLLLIITVIGAIGNMFIHMPGWYYLLGLKLIIGLYVVLRRAAKQKRPSFLLSWISYHLYQPSKIDMRNEKITR